MTHEERVREAAPCSCYAPRGAPDDGRGPLKDGSHYPACPANDWPEIVELVAAVEREAREAEWDAGVERWQAHLDTAREVFHNDAPPAKDVIDYIEELEAAAIRGLKDD